MLSLIVWMVRCRRWRLSKGSTDLRLAWQEPHSEHHVVETARSVNVVPLPQPFFPANRAETSSSFGKYLHENTSVSHCL